MKKLLAFIAALLLVVTLASCDKSGSVKKAYEKEEYTVSETTMENVYSTPLVGTLIKSSVQSNYNEKQQEKIASYSVIFAYKGTEFAIIVKFPSSSDVKSFLTTENEDGSKDSSSYDDAKKNGLINGNLLLLVGSDNAKKIYK